MTKQLGADAVVFANGTVTFPVTDDKLRSVNCKRTLRQKMQLHGLESADSDKLFAEAVCFTEARFAKEKARARYVVRALRTLVWAGLPKPDHDASRDQVVQMNKLFGFVQLDAFDNHVATFFMIDPKLDVRAEGRPTEIYNDCRRRRLLDFFSPCPVAHVDRTGKVTWICERALEPPSAETVRANAAAMGTQQAASSSSSGEGDRAN